MALNVWIHTKTVQVESKPQYPSVYVQVYPSHLIMMCLISYRKYPPYKHYVQNQYRTNKDPLWLMMDQYRINVGQLRNVYRAY